MCKNSLGILNYNEIIAGGLGWGVGFWFVCVYVCVQQTPMHLLRPGDRGKFVLRVLDGSRGGVEAGGGGGNGARGHEMKRRERRKKKNSGYDTLLNFCLLGLLFGTCSPILIHPFTHPTNPPPYPPPYPPTP